MSNVFNGTAITYFQVPQVLIPAGHLSTLTESSVKLYIAVCYEAQRTSRVELQLTNEEIRLLTGLSSGSVTKAKAELQERGLLRNRRGLGGAAIYSLSDPNTTQPLARGARSQAQSGAGQSNAGWLYRLGTSGYTAYFEARLTDIRQSGKNRNALCPFHNDTKPSLSVDVQHGLWYCHSCKAGGGILDFEMTLSKCNRSEALRNIAQIVGVDDEPPCPAAMPEAVYPYFDEHGELLFEVLRHCDKRFQQRRPHPSGRGYVWGLGDARRVLYRLPQVVAATHVIVTEGEKDADNVSDLGLLGADGKAIAATTCNNGAGAWRNEYSSFLENKSVVILADSDDAGREHADHIKRAIQPFAQDVRIINFAAEGVKDVSEYLETHTAEELMSKIGKDWFERVEVIVP